VKSAGVPGGKFHVIVRSVMRGVIPTHDYNQCTIVSAIVPSTSFFELLYEFFGFEASCENS
jgi:hypothetical protein